MDIGFPDYDEIRPITCKPLIKEKNDIQMNDVLGGYSLTMLDTLDMFAFINNTQKFHKYIDLIIDNVSFNVDSTVQVFETTIRAMGGLLSGHLYASIDRLGHSKKDYNGELLTLAYDLGERLLPAFDTPSGIPHPRVNLKKGIVPVLNGNYVDENCASGAGSLLLEFGLLTRLTGDERFEFVARRAFLELWTRRSSLDLLAMQVDSKSGQFMSPLTGIGASIDSLYEYAVKYYVLFGDDQFWSIFQRMFDSLYIYSYDGWSFKNINYQTGNIMTSWCDSLAAFFPGLQVLAGNIEVAIKTHIWYYKLWTTFASIPERWTGIFDLKSNSEVMQEADPVTLEWWPLRPEFIESNYYIYQATKDPFYLQVGKNVLKDINMNCKVKCGYAGIQDVRTGKQSDRMETFFLSETVKYLYLLFTPEHKLNKEYSNFVFSTEAHPFWYDKDVVEQASVLRFKKLGKKVENNSKTVKSSLLESPSLYDRLMKYWDNRRKKNLKRIKSGDKNKNNNNSYPPKCSVWKSNAKETSLGGTSFIPEWEHFYTLDSVYNYTQPAWIKEKQPNRVTAFELEPHFYFNYIDSDRAACRSMNSSLMGEVYQVTFNTDTYKEKNKIDKSDKKNKQNSKKTTDNTPVIDKKNNIIHLNTLDGITILISNIKQKGIDMFKIISMDNLRVNDEVIEINQLFENKHEYDKIVQVEKDGTIMLQETPISNARVLTKY